MKDRIRLVRETATGAKLTQAKFAEELHVTRDMIACYEGGRVVPTPLFVNALCDKYGINEDWLRTGKGEMFRPLTREAEIAKIADTMLNEVEPSVRNELIKLIADADQGELELLVRYARKLIEALDDNSRP